MQIKANWCKSKGIDVNQSKLVQGFAPMSGYLGVFAIDINAVCPPEGAVYGQMAKQFAVRSELR